MVDSRQLISFTFSVQTGQLASLVIMTILTLVGYCLVYGFTSWVFFYADVKILMSASENFYADISRGERTQDKSFCSGLVAQILHTGEQDVHFSLIKS